MKNKLSVKKIICIAALVLAGIAIGFITFATNGFKELPHIHRVVIDEAVAPTCTNTGLTKGKHCVVCNETLVAQNSIPAKGHQPNGTATCTTDQTCSVCNEIVVKATGHKYTFVANDVTATPSVILTHSCSNCQHSYTETITPTDFTLSGGNLSWIGYNTYLWNSELVIPAFFQKDGVWYRVTNIGERAFQKASFLQHVTIPDSVETIGDSAFGQCGSLTNITLSNNLKSIGKYAFYETALTSITIPDSVTNIGEGAFQSCSKLESITLPFVGLTEDGTSNTRFSYIFGWVPSSLKTVVVTGGTTIGKGAFSGCTSLTSITIPDSVTSIGQRAFSGCSSLTTINIPNGVTNIGQAAFYKCSSLTSITIPNSVTSIEKLAFDYCSKLTSVKFEGTVDQWKAIEFGLYLWYIEFPTAEIICTDGVLR